mmetsp:Transcript_10692/g.10806  ORF Transcript_10692/g.10806 Transcript_10692/m.10806 type:complete len:92 (-) Transcript_10692:81-356(-)
MGQMVPTYHLFERDEDIKEMRTGLSPEFDESYLKAYQKYIEGRWESSYLFIQDCLRIHPTDGPCITLMEFLLNNNLNAPEDWKGYRELIEK